jgi:hypothetical protein
MSETWPCGCPVTREDRARWAASKQLAIACACIVAAEETTRALAARDPVAVRLVAQRAEERIITIRFQAPPWCPVVAVRPLLINRTRLD